MNKIIKELGKIALKKVKNKSVNKAMEKASETYKKIKNEVLGIKTLNVGEKETIKCFKNSRNSVSKCKNIGNKVRKNYHKNKNI